MKGKKRTAEGRWRGIRIYTGRGKVSAIRQLKETEIRKRIRRMAVFGFERKPKQNRKVIDFSDDRINVLLLGNSGCGKSTLINALLGREEAETGAGTAVTRNIEVYEDEKLPFRMIDTVGFEYGLFRQYRIRNDLAKFSQESIKNRDVRKLVHVIWYCIDGTSKRVDPQAMDYIQSVVGSWKEIPIIFVITKSYSEKEMEENTAIAHDALVAYNARHPRNPLNVKDILCVVSKEYPISDDLTVPPYGLDTLLNRTNELAPAAKKAADSAMLEIDLKLKRDKADFSINASTAASIAVGAVPIPVPDSTVLVPIQTKMFHDILSAYEQQEDDMTRQIRKYIVQAGATTIAGKTLVKALKQIPGIAIAASVIDAAAAGAVTFVSGKTAQIVFERFYTGEWSREGFNVDAEIQQILKDLIPDLTSQLKEYLEGFRGTVSAKDIVSFFHDLIQKKKNG